MKKFVGLSDGSLKIVNDWYDEYGNAGTPLGQAYENAAVALGGYNRMAVYRQLANSVSLSKASKDSGQLKILAYQHRDSVGRVILDMIKRSKKHKAQ